MLKVAEYGCAAVYFAGEFAYRINKPSQAFHEDVAGRCVAAIDNVATRGYEMEKAE